MFLLFDQFLILIIKVLGLITQIHHCNQVEKLHKIQVVLPLIANQPTKVSLTANIKQYHSLSKT